MGVASSKTVPASVTITSPRKSLRPNMSLCHTDTHSARVSSSLMVVLNCVGREKSERMMKKMKENKKNKEIENNEAYSIGSVTMLEIFPYLHTVLEGKGSVIKFLHH